MVIFHLGWINLKVGMCIWILVIYLNVTLSNLRSITTKKSSREYGITNLIKQKIQEIELVPHFLVAASCHNILSW